MVTQKEKIAEITGELNILNTQLKEAQEAFDAKHSARAEAIARVSAEIQKVWDEHKAACIELAKEVSNRPEEYYEGRTYNTKNELESRIREAIKATVGDDIRYGVISNVIHSAYSEACKPVYETYRAKTGELVVKRDKLEDFEDYKAMAEALRKAKDMVKWKTQLLANFSKVGFFRQWAKEQKEDKEGEALDALKEKYTGAIKAWCEANLYQPKA